MKAKKIIIIALSALVVALIVALVSVSIAAGNENLSIAEYFAKVSGYRIEETPAASGYAGYKDWFINFYDRPGYTIEAGLGENPLPMGQFPKIYKDNVGILLGGMTET